MNLAHAALELRRRGATRPVALARTWFLIDQASTDDALRASRRLLSGILALSERTTQCHLRALQKAGVLVLESSGSFASRKPSFWRLKVRFCIRAFSRNVSRTLSRSQQPTQVQAPLHAPARAGGYALTLITDDALTDDVRGSSKSSVNEEERKERKSVTARARPEPSSDDAADEADIVTFEQQDGKSPEEIERDLGFLRRHRTTDRVRYCLQTVKLKLARKKPVASPNKLFWRLIYDPLARGEEGADANRAEFLASLEPQAEVSSLTAPDVARKVANALKPVLAPLGHQKRTEAMAGSARAFPTPSKKEPDCLKLMEDYRAQLEKDRKEGRSPVKVSVSPTPSTFVAKPLVSSVGEGARAEALRAYEKARMAHAEAECLALARGEPIPPPPLKPLILC